MDEHLVTRLESKIDSIQERIASVDVTLAVQAEQLSGHIRRTEIAEKRLDSIDNQLEPIQKHVNHVEGALKFVGIISLVLGIVAGVMSLINLVGG